MKKHILYWLFGTDNIERYMELLYKNTNHAQECKNLIDDHLKTLEREKDVLELMRKLIKICQNHEIDVNEEIKHIEL